jgi:cephalosporin hydroxylase
VKTNWKEIKCMVEDEQVEKEYLALDKVCGEVREELGFGLCIEVGSFRGRSTALLAQYFIVMAIDTWGLGEDQGQTGTMENYSDFGNEIKPFLKNMTDRELIYWLGSSNSVNRVIPICGVSGVLHAFPYLGAKFVFIDADHTYPSVLHDINSCAKHLEVGGIISIHDYCRPGWGYGDKSRDEVDPWYGNKKSVDEFLERNKNFEIKNQVEGILFIEKKDFKKYTMGIDPACSQGDNTTFTVTRKSSEGDEE